MYSTRVTNARVLDFDIETRRIGFHNGGRFNPDGCEPVVIAWQFNDRVNPIVRHLNPTWDSADLLFMVDDFCAAYENADMVTGHYIRKFDLPIINGACLELGFGPLPSKLTSDTKDDLVNVQGLSKSQENLSALLELEASKFHMNDNAWREVARLTSRGLTEAKKRVVGDVRQHMALRERLIEEGFLGAPEVWSP